MSWLTLLRPSQAGIARWMAVGTAATATLALVATGAPTAQAAEAKAPTSVVGGAILGGRVSGQPTAKPAGFNQIKITWKGATKRTKIWVYGGEYYGSLLKSKTRFKANARRTGATTGVVTVPAKFRHRLGGSTGRGVYLYIFAKDGSSTKKSKLIVSMAGVKRAVGTTKQRIKVATYNVGSVRASVKTPGQKWSKRRLAVVRAVTKAKPDILAVQEAGMSSANHPKPGRTQEADLRALLAAKGYGMNVTEAQIQAIWNRPGNQELTSWVFYRKSSVKLLASGIRYSGAGTRYFSWGKFQSLRSKKVFYVASVHLQTGGNKKSASLRAKQAANWNLFMGKLAGRSPMFIAGDFNSDYRGEANSAPQRLVAKGWQDSAASLKRRGFEYSSWYNWVKKPAKAPYGQGGKIDHIMSKNTSGVFQYVNQVVLKRGKFVESYRGSDHNMQYAIIGIR